MSRIPRPHEIYRHFKGNLYQILAVAEHSETGEQLVIYQALYGEFKIYARPLQNFLEEVDREKYPDATQLYRFALQGAEQPDEQAKQETVSKQTAQPAPEQQPAPAQQPKQQPAQDSEEAVINPGVLRFLDADTYEERLEILIGERAHITDEMITTMAIACDVEVPEGSLEERFEGLKNCLVTLEKYECNRLR